MSKCIKVTKASAPEGAECFDVRTAKVAQKLQSWTGKTNEV